MDHIAFTSSSDRPIVLARASRIVAILQLPAQAGEGRMRGLDPSRENRMGVSTRLLEPQDTTEIRLRHFEGADSFRYRA